MMYMVYMYVVPGETTLQVAAGLSGGQVLRGFWSISSLLCKREVRNPGHAVTALGGQFPGDRWARTRAENMTNDCAIMAAPDCHQIFFTHATESCTTGLGTNKKQHTETMM